MRREREEYFLEIAETSKKMSYLGEAGACVMITSDNRIISIGMSSKNIKTGKVLENTFRTSEKLEEVRVEKHKKEYLYFDGSFYVFMDSITYEQISIPVEIIGDLDKYLIENMVVGMKLDPKGEILGIELPITVVQEIAECEPNVRGNTASASGKKAVTANGLTITVPFFIEVGDKIKIDTRNGEYIERV